MPHHPVGAQHLVSEPRGVFLVCRRVGSNAQWKTTYVAVCTGWVCVVGPDGNSRWSIYSVLQHAMCLDDHCARIQRTGGSEDMQCNELVCLQHRDGEDSSVQDVLIGSIQGFNV